MSLDHEELQDNQTKHQATIDKLVGDLQSLKLTHDLKNKELNMTISTLQDDVARLSEIRRDQGLTNMIENNYKLSGLMHRT